MQTGIRGNPGPLPCSIDAALEPQTGAWVVLDTNILLDLWLFRNPATAWAAEALRTGALRWIATQAMLDELMLVSCRSFPARYTPSPALRSAPHRTVPTPPACRELRCRDSSDQMFIDLALEARAPLWTRDRDLLALRRKASRQGLLIETPEEARLRMRHLTDQEALGASNASHQDR